MDQPNRPSAYADLEIRILAKQGEGYPIEMTLNSEQEFPAGYLDPGHLPWVPMASPKDDGVRLFEWLLSDDRLKTAWAEVRGQRALCRVRLRIDDAAPELLEACKYGHDTPEGWEWDIFRILLFYRATLSEFTL